MNSLSQKNPRQTRAQQINLVSDLRFAGQEYWFNFRPLVMDLQAI